MANTTVNKVVLGNETLIDLTPVTVTADKLASGYTALDASGALITGTLDSITGSVYQDADGYLVVDEGESTAPQGNISITANGTYDVSGYAEADVDVPVGMSKTDLRNFVSRSIDFTDIDWPDGLTTIGTYAFAGCTYFNSPSLPSTIRIINNHAFNSCTRLALTELPSGVRALGTYAFYQCNALALTSLPDSIANISAYAFYNCGNLALTELPSGVTSIDSYAFYNCGNLALTELPSGVTSIGSNAFYNCGNLALTELPSGVTSINSQAFTNCTKLAITEIPSGVTNLSSNIFTGCTGLTSISSEGAITSCSYPVFTGNSTNPTMQLKSASFPNMALTSNINYVFGNTTAAYACQQLEFCDIGSTTGIAGNAFANCYKLQTLVLRKTSAVCTLANVSAFLNTPMRGYNDLTGTVYVPSALIESYKTATNWKTLYDAGTVTFAAIEGSEYELE